MKNTTRIDKLIAENVMEWKQKGYWWTDSAGKNMYRIENDFNNAWYPSENIKHVWQVVEKLSSNNYIVIHNDRDKRWTCEINSEVIKIAENAPLAICLAALKTKNIKVDKE